MRAAVAILFVSALVSCATTSPFDKLKVEAADASARGDHAREVDAREQLRRMAPRSPHVAYDLAVAYANAGRPQDAVTALTDAAAKGYVDAWGARKDPAFAGLTSNGAFREALARVEANQSAWEQELLDEFKVIDASAVPSFADLRALDTLYAKRLEAVKATWRDRPPVEYARDRNAVLSESIAALRRFAAEHPADREAALRKVVDVFFTYHRNYPPRWWGPSGIAAAAAADEYLAAFPSTDYAAEIAFRRACARWFGRPKPSSREPGEPVIGDASVSVVDPEAAARAVAELTDVARRYPGTAAAGKAEYFAFFLEYFASGQQPTSALRGKLDTLKDRYRGDREVSKYANWFGSEEVFPAFRDWNHFDETDVSGRRWKLASLRGKVVLINFWATWCGSCVDEVPLLQRLHEKHAKDGLVLIGVSVDDDRAALDAFVTQRGLGWPQVSRPEHSLKNTWLKYRVNTFPTNIVIDRDGKVTSLGLKGAALEKSVEDVMGGAHPSP